MANKKQSNEIVCISCHQPPPCTAGYSITGFVTEPDVDFPKKSTSYATRVLITDGKGQKLTSTLVPKKCSNNRSDCPKLCITEVAPKSGDSIILELTSSKTSGSFTVNHDCYAKPDENNNLSRHYDKWEWLKLAFKTDASDIVYKKYVSKVTDCGGQVQKTIIKTYPKISVEGGIELKGAFDVESTKAIKRRYEYTKEEAIKLKKEAKVGKWSDVKSNVCDREYSINFNSNIIVGAKEHPFTLRPIIKKARHFTNKQSPIHKLSSVLDGLGKHSMAGKNGGIVRKLTLLPPEFKISGKKELAVMDDTPYFAYEYDLDFKQLFGIVVIIDVIDVLLSLLATKGAGAAWVKLRTKLEEAKERHQKSVNKYGAYGLFYIDLVLSGKVLEGIGKVTNKEGQIDCTGKIGNELGLQIKAGVEWGVQIFVVRGQMEMATETATAIRGALIVDKKGMGIEFGHEGIRSIFTFTFKGGVNLSKNSSTTSFRDSEDATSNETSFVPVTANVTWVEKSTFGPYYFIPFASTGGSNGS